MEVVEACSAWLSDYEVLEHLRAQKIERDRISARIGRPVRSAENILTVEFETLEYLERRVPKEMSPKVMDELLSMLKKYHLTKAEKLQIINILPQTEVEFYLIVEECEERFTADQITEILDFIVSLVQPIA